MSGNFFDDLLESDDSDEASEKEMFEINDQLDRKLIDDAPLQIEDQEEEQYLPQINSVTLVGRVGQEPNPRYFEDGKVVLQISLAVKRKYHPLERQCREIQYGDEETDWFNLVFWGNDAEFAAKYLTKGARIGITGSLNAETWNDRLTGEKRRSHKVNVKHLDILESRAEAELRMGNRRQRNGGNVNPYEDSDEGNGPISAGSGGFFD